MHIHQRNITRQHRLSIRQILFASLASLPLLLTLAHAAGESCSPQSSCPNPDECCSQFGWCDIGDAWCGTGCQSGPCYPTASPTSPPIPTPPPIPVMDLTQPADTATASHDDSRLIAYVGNWQSCPTVSQTDAYTHIVVAFAVTYTPARGWGPNECDQQCNIITNTNYNDAIQVCDNREYQQLIDSWRNAGKKVILGFGGAAMGESWSGGSNNCWDYCFGREEQLSTALVNIVQNQRFDGVDIDYEYCYDKQNGRHFGCQQVSSLYSDEKAINFLSTLTSKLRQKLDALGRGHLELSHAPMDSDLVTDSPYYQMLKEQSLNLDFIMPQFYNGLTRPVTNGFDVETWGSTSTSSIYSNIANDIFGGKPNKVVFGFCISDCGATRSNANAAEAIDVLQQVKTYNNGEFSCNGGAFFWVAFTDVGGSWSDSVWEEVRATSGCSSTPSPSTPVPSAPSISNLEVVPMKFIVKGLPNDAERAREEVENEMTTILKRILLRLEERIPGMKVSSVAENEAAITDPIKRGEATLYYNINIFNELRIKSSSFRPIIIQELRGSYKEILGEIPFSDAIYISRDLDFNWCTNTESGGYPLCVHEILGETPPPSSVPQPATLPVSSQSDSDSGDDGALPGWAVALIVIFCLLLLGCLGLLVFIKLRRDRAKERNFDVHSENDSSSQVWYTDDNSQPSYDARSKVDSIEHASYGSKRIVLRDPSIDLSVQSRDPSVNLSVQGRDPTMYSAGKGRDPTMYLPGQGRQSRQCRDPTMYIPGHDPEAASVSSSHSRRYDANQAPLKPNFEP